MADKKVVDIGLPSLPLGQWIPAQMAESAIPPHLADLNGISPHLKEPQGYKIPYHDPSGQPYADYFKVRVQHPGTTFGDYDKGTGGFAKSGYSKYWTPKGKPALPYWPRHPGVDHIKNIANMDVPIFVVEGEKKALSMQNALIGAGIQASCVGIPGVHRGTVGAVLQDLGFLPCVMKDSIRRVFTVFDREHEDLTAEEMTRSAEVQVTTYFQDRLGAEVYQFHWPVPEEGGVQKVDDYIAAGGNIGEALEYSLSTESAITTERMKYFLEYNELFCLLDGKVVIRTSPLKVLTPAELRTHRAYDNEPVILASGNVSSRQKIYYTDAWIEWRGRTEASDLTFLPPPIGQPPERFVGTKLNLAPPWPESAPWGGDFTPLEELIDHLCSECSAQRTWLRQHIAHAALHPTELTSNVVAFSDGGGTGKGLLFRTLSKMFGAYHVNITTELTEKFNVGLAGKLIGVYDEPETAGRYRANQSSDIEKVTKRIAGNPTIGIRSMQKDTYEVPNYIRLFMTTNLEYVVTISKTDRRWNYVGGSSPLPSAKADAYVDWLAKADLGGWPATVDLDGYHPMKLGPESPALMDVRDASKSPLSVFLTEYMPVVKRDVWWVDELYPQYLQWCEANKERSIGNTHFARAIRKELGAKCSVSRPIRDTVASCSRRVVWVRRAEHWDGASDEALRCAAANKF